MKGAGDTLNRLKDEPKDTLALLAVKEDLTNLVVLYWLDEGLSYKYTIIGRQPTSLYSQELDSASSSRASWQALSSKETL